MVQVQLEDLYTGPELALEERYAAALVTFFVCVIFSPGMPVLWCVGFVAFFFFFWAEKVPRHNLWSSLPS